MRALTALAVAALVAGCMAPETQGPSAATPSGNDDAASDPTVVALGADCGAEDCFEPTVAIDPAGRIFVANGRTAPLLRSDDGGATWTTLDPVPLPAPLPFSGSAYQRDVLIQVAPSGRLYYSALVAAGPPSAATAGVVGIQVAWSEDGGASWAGNVLLSSASYPDVPLSVADRQWMGFGSREGAPIAYLSFSQVPSGIWTARSDDGGATWSSWQRAIAFEERRNFGQAGAPVVDPAGIVAIPACAGVGPRIYVSEDDAETFRPAEHPSGSCSSFPQLAVLADGSLAVVWAGGAELRVSVSDDAGASWSEAVVWGVDPFLGPWPIALPNGGLAVVFFSTDAGDLSLRLARGHPTGEPSDEATLDGGFTTFPSAPTDFAHGAGTIDGTVVAVWAKGDDLHVAFSR